jgi:16S rRNA (cytidine1402-2'-O)-methyltransferase
VGTLFLVATPIGNLEDISARALRILGEVQLIAAEDTRHTRKLLSHYGIHTQLTSYHEHSNLRKLENLLAGLSAGDIALVSDAGTPGLNDPGFELVRAALDAGHDVSPIPGPSAPIAALVTSGLPAHSFLYLGYLPRKSSERKRLLTNLTDIPYTLLFLETPHRLLAALEDLQVILGDRETAIAREMTKQHEEIFRGTLSAGHAHFKQQEPRGEFTLVVAGSTARTEPWSEAQLSVALEEHLTLGESPSHIASLMAAESGWPRRKIYRLITEIQHKFSPD